MKTVKRYIDAGFYVFPCNMDKTPQTPNGFKDATDDYDIFRDILIENPIFQIGLRTGMPTAGKKILVVDIDVKDNISADEKINLISEHIGELPATLQILTPSGGRHLYYYLSNPEVKVSSRSNIFKFENINGIDIRCDNGYVIVPSNNNEYSVYDSDSEIINIEEINQIPEWLEKRLEKKLTTVNFDATTSHGIVKELSETQKKEVMSALGFIDPDDRDNWIRVGCMFYNENVIDGFQLWTAWSQESEKYNEHTQHRTWKSFSGYTGPKLTFSTLFHEARQRGWNGIVFDDSVKIDLSELMNSFQTKKKFDLPKFPEHLLNLNGMIGETMQYIESQAIKSQPIFALTAAISAVGNAFGRKVQTETGLRTNLYMINVGRSGCGKDNGRQCIKKIFDKADQFRRVGVESIASGSAINTALSVEPASLFLIDEIGRLFKTVKNSGSKSPHLADIVDVLLKVYSSSNTRYQPKSYADKDKNISINQPCLSILGATTEQVLFDSLHGDQAEDGFLSRFLIYFTEDPNPKPCFKPSKEPPLALIDKYKTAMELTISEAVDNPEVKTIQFSEDAREYLTAFTDEIFLIQEKLLSNKKENYANIYNRTIQTAQQYALIRAMSDNLDVITLDCIEWGAELARFNADQMNFVLAHYVADSTVHANINKVFNIISSYGEAGIKQSDLTRRLQSMSSRDRNEALKTLTEAQRITVVQEKEGGGRPGVRFYATG